LLSSEELAILFHLPIKVKDERINYAIRPRLPLPAMAGKGNGVTIGFLKQYRRGREQASIPLSDLTRHVYIIGLSGTGKTSLLVNIIAQAQEKGYCVHVIDPHGDMAYDLVECLPERLDDIIFLDPLRVRFSINPFELPPYRDEYERAMLTERIIGQIVEVMKRIFGERYWGPSLNRTFQNVVRTLYLRDDRPTFEDILNVLLGKIEDESEVFKELKQELKKIPPERFDAVINKVDPFVKNALLRMLFCNKRSSIDFNELLKPKKLVIWRLAKAEITEMNMQMIGSALITKLWFYCASRPREERNPVLLVIDEFKNFAFLETLEVMIAEARKFGIGLILSHQHTKQLTEALLGEVLGNTATKIIFRVSGEDALTLARSINMRSERSLASLLVSLPDGSAVVKLRAGFGEEPIRPFEILTLPPFGKEEGRFR
jgi:DNA helicase HerA-like ATPase